MGLWPDWAQLGSFSATPDSYTLAIRWWWGLEASQRLSHMSSRWCWLLVSSQLGLLAKTPTSGLSMWPVLPLRMVAGSQELGSQELYSFLWPSLGIHTVSLPHHSVHWKQGIPIAHVQGGKELDFPYWWGECKNLWTCFKNITALDAVLYPN